jgi:hypothetical protein
MEYLQVNANDQLDLKGLCTIGCDWTTGTFEFSYNVYMIIRNKTSLLTTTQLVPFKSGYFVAQGEHNSDLSVSSSLFCDYPSQFEWKFELNLFMSSNGKNRNFTTTTSLLVYVNHPPKSGSCNIEPKNGTTSTLFNIHCDAWIDEVGHVAAFSFYGLIF